MKLICIGCGRQPSEIEEYCDLELLEGLTPDEFVRTEEGTMNLRQPRRALRPNESPTDIVGRRFGSLIVLSFADIASNRAGRIYWRVRCDCGREMDKRWSSIRDAIRCGRCTPIVHGHSRREVATSEYRSWAAMHQRCSNPTNPDFKHYGGRGIAVCDRWQTFDNFLKDMGPKPFSRAEIERTGNNLGYTPQNCIWADRKIQTRNKRTTLRTNYRGKLWAVIDLCDELKIPYGAVRQRLRKGWSPEQAIEFPHRGRGGWKRPGWRLP